MNKWILISVGVIVIICAVVGLYFLKDVKKSPLNELEECKTYSYGGEGGVNILFFADKKDVKKYADEFFNFEPFNLHKNKFNFYYIDNYSPECELYKGIALLCYSKELIKKAGSCPNDIIAVVREEDSKIRASAYMNVISLNSKLSASVFVHEIGHAFANLADEYTPAKVPRGAKNCVKECNSFGEEKEGCFAGCSEEEYYRSIDRGIMKTLSGREFGNYNEEIILESISEEKQSISGMAISELKDCSKEKYYLVEGSYNGSDINLGDKSIEIGCVGNNGNGAFEYKVVFGNGEESKNFNPELIFTDEMEGGGVFESDKEFILRIHADERIKNVEILSDGKKLADVNFDELKEGNRPCKI